MMGSRSFYAVWEDIVFEFQDKRFRDWFVKNGRAIKISSKTAYSDYHYPFIKVSHRCYLKSQAWNDQVK